MIDPSAYNQIRDGVFIHPIRIYYEDTDFSGVVYHANYLRYMERARSEALRVLGVSHQALAARPDPLAFAIRKVTIEYFRPAVIDDLLEIYTHFNECVGARIVATQKVMRGDDRLVEAQVEVVSIGMDGRPRRLPAELVAALATPTTTKG